MLYVINNLHLNSLKSVKTTTKYIIFRMKNALFAKCDEHR